MEHIDDDARENINSEFAQLLEEKGGSPVEVVIETKPGAAERVADQIPTIDGASLGEAGIIAPDYVAATIPSERVDQVARLDGVVLIHHDRLVGIRNLGERLRQIPFLNAETDPIRGKLSNKLFDAFGAQDKYVGRVGISRVEVPAFNFAQAPPGDPISAAVSVGDRVTGNTVSGKEYVPTSESVDWIRDSGITDGYDGSDSRVAILDTGHTPIEPANGFRRPHLESYVPGEPPLDGLGHGSWCSYTVAGAPSPSAWGTCEGVAPRANYAHMKCLNTFPGFGKTSWILKAMDSAIAWGADVISMSLGGTQQGPVQEDPYARFIRKRCKENAGDESGAIFVVAAGNSGPGMYEVGSPGIAPKALTVASWSLKDAAPAFYSSRGPQGEWYAGKEETMRQHAREVGTEEFVKPDVAAPGGGRETLEKDDEEAELLHQVETGWMEGFHDGVRDARGSMKGTSMATPHVAGLVLRLYEAGLVKTAAEVKQVVRTRGAVGEYPTAAANANATRSGKNVAVGYGPIRESLFDPDR